MEALTIAIEPMTHELAQEILPLGQASWDECSEIKKDTCAYHGQRGLQVDPNIDVYLALESAHMLLTLTLRDEGGVLRGYCVAILYYSLHLRKELCGNVDMFYVQPDYRRAMSRFITSVEEELRQRNVSIVGWPVSMSGKMFDILQKRGYTPDDTVMELKLKDLPKE